MSERKAASHEKRDFREREPRFVHFQEMITRQVNLIDADTELARHGNSNLPNSVRITEFGVTSEATFRLSKCQSRDARYPCRLHFTEREENTDAVLISEAALLRAQRKSIASDRPCECNIGDSRTILDCLSLFTASFNVPFFFESEKPSNTNVNLKSSETWRFLFFFFFNNGLPLSVLKDEWH